MNPRLLLSLTVLTLLSSCNRKDTAEPENSFSGHYEYQAVVSAPLHAYRLADGEIEEIQDELTQYMFGFPVWEQAVEKLNNCDEDFIPARIDAITLDVNGDTGEMSFACGGEVMREAVTYTKEDRLIILESQNFTYKMLGELFDYDFYKTCLYVILRVSSEAGETTFAVDEIKNCETFGPDGKPQGFKKFDGQEACLPYLFENTTFWEDTLTAIQVFLSEK